MFEFARYDKFVELITKFKAQKNKERTIEILKPPEILMVTIQRLTTGYYGLMKDDRKVFFKQEIQLYGNPSWKFRLCGLVMHVGGAQGGHYVSAKRAWVPEVPFVKSSSKTLNSFRYLNWNFMSDTHSEVITTAKLQMMNPYILVYEREIQDDDDEIPENTENSNKNQKDNLSRQTKDEKQLDE